jgi:hypothetical protein
MGVRVGTGWQTIIADLSMILFMLTASAVARQDPKPDAAPAHASPVQPAARSEPVAVWIAGEGAPPLREWLAQQPRDSRQQVTVTATYAPGAMDEALTRAQALARQAGDARVVVEPGAPGVRVVIGYDAPEARLARPLRN